MCFKYETHLHTKEGSACASSSSIEMVKAHIKKGYAGFVITDHFFNGNTSIASTLPWEQRVEAFCEGYKKAYLFGKENDFDVFFGWEYNYKGTEFLTYGLDEQFLLEHPQLIALSPQNYFDLVHQAGGFIIHAHPYREAPYIKAFRFFTDKIDGVEAYNLAHHPSYNDKAVRYAKAHGLPMTSGSDTHHAEDLAGGGIMLKERARTIQALIDSIRSQEIQLVTSR